MINLRYGRGFFTISHNVEALAREGIESTSVQPLQKAKRKYKS